MILERFSEYRALVASEWSANCFDWTTDMIDVYGARESAYFFGKKLHPTKTIAPFNREVCRDKTPLFGQLFSQFSKF